MLDDSKNQGKWEAVWDMGVTQLTMLDPIRPDDQTINSSLNEGTVSRRYRSWYMPDGPSLFGAF